MKLYFLVVLLLIGGCTSMSDNIDKSPCACNYEYVNQGSYAALMPG